MDISRAIQDYQEKNGIEILGLIDAARIACSVFDKYPFKTALTTIRSAASRGVLHAPYVSSTTRIRHVIPSDLEKYLDTLIPRQRKGKGMKISRITRDGIHTTGKRLIKWSKLDNYRCSNCESMLIHKFEFDPNTEETFDTVSCGSQCDPLEIVSEYTILRQRQEADEVMAGLPAHLAKLAKETEL